MRMDPQLPGCWGELSVHSSPEEELPFSSIDILPSMSGPLCTLCLLDTNRGQYFHGEGLLPGPKVLQANRSLSIIIPHDTLLVVLNLETSEAHSLTQTGVAFTADTQ